MSRATQATATIVRFHRTGGAEVLQYDTLPVGDPGPDEVRLRIKAIGINRAEVLFREGRYMEKPVFPARNGYEASGIIDAVGPAVDRTLIGKTVATIPGTFKLGQSGVYGDVAVLPQRTVAEYPSELSYEEGAAIWMQYLTAYGSLIWLGGITPGQFVVINAASSSVGLGAIDVVRAEGGVSIALTRTAAKRDELLRLGANYVVVTEQEDLLERVTKITDGKGARIVLDPVGGKQLMSLAAATAFGGSIFVYGGLASEPTPFPLFSTIAKYLSLRGYNLHQLVAGPAFAAAKQYIVEQLAAKRFKPFVGKTFHFSNLADAHRYMESNQQIGKIVVTVG